MRQLTCLLVALMVLPTAGRGQFHFRDVSSASIDLTENGQPVFTFNYGMMLKEGVAPDRARCCYLSPVYAPNGVVVTDDFPPDHLHHRGISWMWPVVIMDGQTYDLWTIKGILDHFEKWERKKAGKGTADLAFQDGWYVGERKVVQENVEIAAHALAEGRRDIDLTIVLRAVGGAEVSIGGTHDQNKGYGGALEIRFAPRTDTHLNSAAHQDAADSDRVPAAWAELTGSFGGRVATVRVTEDPSNPGFPNGWCLRHYGFVGVDYPGLQLRRLDSRIPLTMKFRVSLTGGAASTAAAQKHALVYTHNGKG